METLGTTRSADATPAHRPELVRRGEAGSTGPGTVGMSWAREALEDLLDRIADDRLGFLFGGDELADVEAHGLRGRDHLIGGVLPPVSGATFA